MSMPWKFDPYFSRAANDDFWGVSFLPMGDGPSFQWGMDILGPLSLPKG